MLGNLHVRFGVGVEVKSLGLHHAIVVQVTAKLSAWGKWYTKAA